MTGGGVVNLLLGSICDLVFVICGIESDKGSDSVFVFIFDRRASSSRVV